jgi:hypothetical protein
VLIEAAHRAGIADPVLVDEPVAAAAYCTRVLGGHLPAGQSLLVFDFGGGTLDLALVRLDPAGTRVVGVGGLQNLGGLDIDHALVGHLGHLLGARDPGLWHRMQNPSGPADLRDRRAFWEDVRAAKEMLSRTTRAPVPVPGGGPPLHLTREELERLAGPLIDRAVDETRRLLDGVSRQAGGVELAGILLVGGSSRIPLVATRLHARFGVGPMVPEQPELPVALGALTALTALTPLTEAPGAAEPVSGYPASGPVSAVPVSGDPGRAWTGQAAGNAQTSGAWAEQPSWPPAAGTVRTGGYGQPVPATDRRGSRATTIIAIAASVALLVLAGATIWFVRDALGSDPGGGSTGSGATNAAPAAASAAPSNTRLAPEDFAWCTVDGRQLLCPKKSVCYDEADDDIECTEPHATELYAANYAVSDLLAADPEAVKSDPTVQSTCNETVMTARSVDSRKTVNWLRYIQPLSVNGVAFIYCLAGPRPEGTTIVGPAFKLG